MEQPPPVPPRPEGRGKRRDGVGRWLELLAGKKFYAKGDLEDSTVPRATCEHPLPRVPSPPPRRGQGGEVEVVEEVGGDDEEGEKKVEEVYEVPASSVLRQQLAELEEEQVMAEHEKAMASAPPDSKPFTLPFLTSLAVRFHLWMAAAFDKPVPVADVPREASRWVLVHLLRVIAVVLDIPAPDPGDLSVPCDSKVSQLREKRLLADAALQYLLWGSRRGGRMDEVCARHFETMSLDKTERACRVWCDEVFVPTHSGLHIVPLDTSTPASESLILNLKSWVEVHLQQAAARYFDEAKAKAEAATRNVEAVLEEAVKVSAERTEVGRALGSLEMGVAVEVSHLTQLQKQLGTLVLPHLSSALPPSTPLPLRWGDAGTFHSKSKYTRPTGTPNAALYVTGSESKFAPRELVLTAVLQASWLVAGSFTLPDGEPPEELHRLLGQAGTTWGDLISEVVPDGRPSPSLVNYSLDLTRLGRRLGMVTWLLKQLDRQIRGGSGPAEGQGERQGGEMAHGFTSLCSAVLMHCSEMTPFYNWLLALETVHGIHKLTIPQHERLAVLAEALDELRAKADEAATASTAANDSLGYLTCVLKRIGMNGTPHESQL